MTSEFLFFFSFFNLSSLPEDKKKEAIEKTKINITEAVVLFEYGRVNENY